MNFKSKQAGGTILGIIIGLVIGLSIAVVVAVTITKTPVPFINKGPRDKQPDPAANQLPDLNKSLYGNREPAKQAAKEFQKEPEPTDPTAIAGDGKEANGAKTQAADKAAADKAKKQEGDAKTADAKNPDGKTDAAKADSAEDKWTYYLQAGAFREQADAENTKAKLALMGIETKISERTGDSGSLYRVRIGPFSQVDAMNKVRSKLSENGVDVAVVRIAK